MKKQMKAKKLVCIGLATLLTFSPLQEMLVQAEETVTPGEVVEELPVMEEEVPGTGEVSAEGFGYTELEDGTLEIRGYGGSNAELVIPAEIDGKKVARIGDRAFYGCSSLTSIEIPGGVSSIEIDAFEGCSSLTNISVDSSNETYSSFDGVLFNKQKTELCMCPEGKKGQYQVPSGVTSIGSYAFGGCSSLTNIEIPSGVMSIEYGVFYGCSSLTSIGIPSGVTSIGISAFEGCSSLTSIEIPGEVTSIGSYAFEGCSSLINISVDPSNETYSSFDGVLFNKQKTVLHICPGGKKGQYQVPSGVTSIRSYAFGGCSGLTSIEMPSGVMSIESRAFYGCSSVTSIEIPSGVTSIGDSAFYGCSSLTSIEIPSGVSSIENITFYGCSSLTSIGIPSEVTSIGEKAFSGCSSLTSIEIPSGVSSIGDSAFVGCSSLTNILVDQYNSTYSSLDGVLFNKLKTELIQCPGGKKGQYQVPSGVTSIREGAFKGCSSVTSIKIPSGVTSIGSYAFEGCSSLTSIEIPSEVSSIAYYAFGGCSSLTSIEIPSGVSSIAYYAFGGCGSLTNILVDQYNSTYSSLDGVLFNKLKTELIQCPGGKKGQYQVPSGVTSIREGAFSGCSSLTSIKIPSGVSSIEDITFYGCSSLTSIEMPSGVIWIGYRAFGDCSSLTSIEIPSGVTSIESCVFEGCSSLTSIEIPSGVTSIGRYAFEGCSSLTSIEIPSGVTSIGYYAFSGCSGLTSIKIPSGVQTIGEECIGYEYDSDSGETKKMENLPTIYCYADSAAYQYAIENDIPYQLIGSVTIHFDANGGTGLSQNERTIVTGDSLGILPTVTRNGYIFKGWYTQATGGTKVSVHTVVTTDTIFYAQWEVANDDSGNRPGKQVYILSGTNTTIILPASVYSYDGKAKTPTVSVSLNGKNLTAGTDYTVTYKNNTNIGTASVIITGKGSYTGTVTKTFAISAKKGTTLTVGVYKYKITSASEVAFAGLKSAKTTKVVIPKTVKIGGKTFKVTSVAAKALYKKTKVTSVTIGVNVKTIGASAFQNCKKLTTVTIKSSKLKSIGKNTFKGIKATAKIKVPSKKLNVYKKLLKNRGQGKRVKITK